MHPVFDWFSGFSVSQGRRQHVGQGSDLAEPRAHVFRFSGFLVFWFSARSVPQGRRQHVGKGSDLTGLRVHCRRPWEIEKPETPENLKTRKPEKHENLKRLKAVSASERGAA